MVEAFLNSGCFVHLIFKVGINPLKFVYSFN